MSRALALRQTPVQKAAQSRRLHRLLEVLRSGKRLLVMTHDNPDPDSVASALAMQLLARRRAGIAADVGYAGIVGRGENQAMVETLGLTLLHRNQIDFGQYDLFGLVDTQPLTGNNSLPAEISPDIVIDHHPMRRQTRKVRFHDIRRHYGATTTVLCEYLSTARIRLDTDLATALFYGIKSETQGLGRESNRADKLQYIRLFPMIDNRQLWRIEHSPLPPIYFAHLAVAIQGTRIHGDTAISSLGEVHVPDMVPTFADFIMRLRGVRWAFCHGYYLGDLYLSLRTSDRAADAGEIIQQMVGSDGKAGGHGMIAGGKVPAAAVEACGRRSQEELLCRRLLELLRNTVTTGRLLVGEELRLQQTV